MVGVAVVAVMGRAKARGPSRESGVSRPDASVAVVTPETFLVEQLRRDRRREIWEFCDELALLSRFSDEVATRTSERWRDVLQTVVRSGRASIEGPEVSFVTETTSERRASLSQGVLFE